MECLKAVKRNENGLSTIPPGLQKPEKIVEDLRGHVENISPYLVSWKATVATYPKAGPQLHRDSGQQPAANTSLELYGTHTPTLRIGGNNLSDKFS